MNGVEKVNSIMSDVQRAVRDIERASSLLEYCTDELRYINLNRGAHDIDDDIMAEVMAAGLPLIEAKYGLSSKEASLVRSHIHTLTKK